MALSWNEIKHRSIEFSKEWENAENERSEAQSFWRDFFNIFGLSSRRVATFEEPVKKLGDKQGFIDLFWKGTLLIEHKSKGRDLDKAYQQALDYFPGLKEEELPKYILVSDFQRFRLYDLDEQTQVEFQLTELSSNIHYFGFIAGYTKKKYKEEDSVNIVAAELMGKLHDKLYEYGYRGHQLEILLVRLVFILFSDDTGIFQKNLFADYIENKTSVDGNDLGSHLGLIFQTLNTPKNDRMINIDEDLNEFSYVNGGLFKEQILLPSFDSEMREMLLKVCYFDWSKISPAIFGSMFQSVMDQEKRRNIGAHYTSEKNIMKVIKSLFLDDLYLEFNKVKSNKNKLNEFHMKLSKLKFLDPACGCGNFLIIAYRELRLLELEILKVKKTDKNYRLDIDEKYISEIDVDQFYGIEIEEFPAKIAELALWLTDHQMNNLLSQEFGQYFARLPLVKAPTIINDNALRIDWNTLIKKDELSYILGNPPFIGKQYQSKVQKEDIKSVFTSVKGSGVLDYVTCWYYLASQYIKNTKIRVAFVSTNSISQGEQVGILWNELFSKYKIKIHFTHRTFKWSNEAKKKANVYVVIIGFACFDISDKHIFEYDNPTSEPHVKTVKNINPYLSEGDDITILKREHPLCDVPEIIFGNMPNDGGGLIFNSIEEKNNFIKNEPESTKYIFEFMDGDSLINNKKRWCLWLVNCNPTDLNKMSEVKKRISLVKETRLKSPRKATQKLAETPYLFGEIRQPKTDYLAIPYVSSENRKYIPIGYLSKDIISHNKIAMIPHATYFHFGIITSIMHMVWVNYTCGRLEGRYNYSNQVVYNNFPWPVTPSQEQKDRVRTCTQKIFDVRNKYSKSSLSDLYNPLSMPPDLVKAHNDLNKSVDRCYRPQPFTSELSRIEFLFELYKKYTDGFTYERSRTSLKNRK